MWELKGAKERMKIFEADLTVDGSFDDAVKGVDGVFHIASTISVCMDDNDLVRHIKMSHFYFYISQSSSNTTTKELAYYQKSLLNHITSH